MEFSMETLEDDFALPDIAQMSHLKSACDVPVDLEQYGAGDMRAFCVIA